MSAHVWTGRVWHAGKLYDAKLAIDFHPQKAAPKLLEKAAKSKRRVASICYGAVTAEILEMQEVIP